MPKIEIIEPTPTWSQILPLKNSILSRTATVTIITRKNIRTLVNKSPLPPTSPNKVEKRGLPAWVNKLITWLTRRTTLLRNPSGDVDDTESGLKPLNGSFSFWGLAWAITKFKEYINIENKNIPIKTKLKICLPYL